MSDSEKRAPLVFYNEGFSEDPESDESTNYTDKQKHLNIDLLSLNYEMLMSSQASDGQYPGRQHFSPEARGISTSSPNSDQVLSSDSQPEPQTTLERYTSKTVSLLKNLISEICTSFENIAESIAMPCVRKKYMKMPRQRVEAGAAAEVGSSTSGPGANPEHPIAATDIPTSEESALNLTAALQSRCLEYREMIQDIAKAALKECEGTTEICVSSWTNLLKQFCSQSRNFKGFKEMSIKHALPDQSSSDISDQVKLLIQASFLRLILEENETFLVQLACCLHTGRMCIDLATMEHRANAEIEILKGKNAHLHKMLTGFRV